MNAIIVYESKYGATEQYAQWLAAKFNIPAKNASQVASTELYRYDLVIIGSPVYIGAIRIKKWLQHNLPALDGKKVVLFIVGAADPRETGKISKVIADNIPPGLHQENVFYLPGRMKVSKLNFLDKALLTIGARLNKEKGARQKMLTDKDEVRIANLQPLFAAITGKLVGDSVGSATQEHL